MTILDAEYQFDRHKLTYFFEAEKRIDFRELVSELFSLYKTRIWMQQVDTSVLSITDLGTELAKATGFLPPRDDFGYLPQVQQKPSSRSRNPSHDPWSTINPNPYADNPYGDVNGGGDFRGYDGYSMCGGTSAGAGKDPEIQSGLLSARNNRMYDKHGANSYSNSATPYSRSRSVSGTEAFGEPYDFALNTSNNFEPKALNDVSIELEPPLKTSPTYTTSSDRTIDTYLSIYANASYGTVSEGLYHSSSTEQGTASTDTTKEDINLMNTLGSDPFWSYTGQNKSSHDHSV